MMPERDFERSTKMCAKVCSLPPNLGPCKVICQHLRWERIDARGQDAINRFLGKEGS